MRGPSLALGPRIRNATQGRRARPIIRKCATAIFQSLTYTEHSSNATPELSFFPIFVPPPPAIRAPVPSRSVVPKDNHKSATPLRQSRSSETQFVEGREAVNESGAVNLSIGPMEIRLVRVVDGLP